MEKQPIDDLFARKLRDAEVPVGSDGFSQLQMRMKPKTHLVRRSATIWWQLASAACLVVAFGLLYRASKTEPVISQPVAITKKGPAKELPLNLELTNPLTNVPERGLQRGRLIDSRAAQDEQTAQVVTYPVQKRATLINQPPAKPLTQAIEPAEQVARAKPHKEIQQLPNTPTITSTIAPIIRVAQSTERPKQLSERTVILTIEESETADTQIASVNTSPTPDPQLHQNSLSGLFGKIKQLKNGEVLAKAAPTANQNVPRNRFGRIFTEVKESLKNETTLE